MEGLPFVPNHFRARLNAAEFALPADDFERLAADLAGEIGGTFRLMCSPSSAIDGSCLVVSRDGEVLLGSRSLGNVCRDAAETLCKRLQDAGADVPILLNKTSTYPALFQHHPKTVR
jgi:hypothetical protein